MKRLIFALALLSTPAMAQAPNDNEIAAAWKTCSQPGLEAIGSLAAQLKAKGQPTWKTGFESCEAVKQAYLKSKAGIDAKAAADKDAADKTAIDALASRIK